MKFLILGSRGMLGQEFMRQLRGKDVIGLGREDIDITNAVEVARKIGNLKPDLIINCAAYNNVDKAEDESAAANAVNGEAVGYLAAAAVECGADFVHFSTDYVFSGEKPITQLGAAACNSVAMGYTEEDMPDPVSVYGRSKALGEQRLLSIFRHPEEPRTEASLVRGRLRDEGSRTPPRADAPRAQNVGNAHAREILRSAQNDNGVKWYIIRTSRLFGRPGIGATSKKSFPEMMLTFAREKGMIEAIDAEVSSPTYVKDLAEATLKLVGIFPSLNLAFARSPSPLGRGEGEGYPSGIYHITNSGACTWYGYAKAAIEAAGVKAEVVPVGPEHFPRKAKRPAFSVLLNTKLPPLGPSHMPPPRDCGASDLCHPYTRRAGPPLRPWQEALREFLVSRD